MSKCEPRCSKHHSCNKCKKKRIGPQGPSGPQGAIGPQGPSSGSIGPQGDTGSSGLQGSIGPQGDTGDQGSQGVQGFTGPQGPTGDQGSQGVQGFTGPQGPTGDQGSQGVQGFTGPQGPTGDQGSQGVHGFTGPQGPTGDQGSQGVQGFTGPQGDTGSSGPQGNTGPVGPQGPVGSGGLIPFSTGIIIDGATVVSAAPILMGFGNHTVEVIDGGGNSTMPPEAHGFTFPIPFGGVITNLQISTDLLVAAVTSINTLGLQYDFEVFRAPSSPNGGIDHASSPYVVTALTSSVRFGFPNTVITPGNPNGFRTATNRNVGGSLVVSEGDRIGIRIRTGGSPLTDASAADITQLSFSASLSYTPS